MEDKNKKMIIPKKVMDMVGEVGLDEELSTYCHKIGASGVVVVSSGDHPNHPIRPSGGGKDKFGTETTYVSLDDKMTNGASPVEWYANHVKGNGTTTQNLVNETLVMVPTFAALVENMQKEGIIDNRMIKWLKDSERLKSHDKKPS